MTRVEVQLLHPLAVPPRYAHNGDAGADLVVVEDVTLAPGERRLVATGIALAIPEGYVGLIHPRSGLASSMGLGIINSPGTVDSGYRGEVLVCLVNLDPENLIHLSAGTRIAQLLIQSVQRATFNVVDTLGSTERGDRGFGSTGTADAVQC